jgi:prephenate dehydratase
MKKIAFLGPTYTFSERMYAIHYQENYEPLYVKTLEEALLAVNDETDALVPIENLSDGFVGPTIDGLIQHDIFIIETKSLPVSFGFMGDIHNATSCYVQFKVQGQCLQFLKDHPQLNVILTASNFDSYQLAKQTQTSAIVPMDALDTKKPHIKHIEDISFNETRFVLLSKVPRSKGLKSACIISPKTDRPGLLHDVLSYFKSHTINLTTIMSRPKKTRIKSYYFYIEFELDQKSSQHIEEVIDLLNTSFEVKWLGMYE